MLRVALRGVAAHRLRLGLTALAVGFLASFLGATGGAVIGVMAAYFGLNEFKLLVGLK